MKISSALPPQPQRIAQLEKKLDEAYGTYMYCEAADFQSAEERATSAAMSREMSQLRKELAELRGDSVLAPAPLTSYLEQLEKQHPLAGVSPAITQKLLPHLWARAEGLSDDVADIHDALNHKKIAPEQLHAALQQQAETRAPLHKKDAPEVRQQTAQILKEGVPKEGPDLFATSEALIQAVLDNPKASQLQKAVAELAQDKSLPVKPPTSPTAPGRPSTSKATWAAGPPACKKKNGPAWPTAWPPCSTTPTSLFLKKNASRPPRPSLAGSSNAQKKPCKTPTARHPS